jgi:hypothetical protein
VGHRAVPGNGDRHADTAFLLWYVQETPGLLQKGKRMLLKKALWILPALVCLFAGDYGDLARGDDDYVRIPE